MLKGPADLRESGRGRLEKRCKIARHQPRRKDGGGRGDWERPGEGLDQRVDCQQAEEKAVKAYLASRDRPVRRVHVHPFRRRHETSGVARRQGSGRPGAKNVRGLTCPIPVRRLHQRVVVIGHQAVGMADPFEPLGCRTEDNEKRHPVCLAVGEIDGVAFATPRAVMTPWSGDPAAWHWPRYPD